MPIAAALGSVIPSTKLEWLFGETMMNVGIAMTIDWVMRNQDGFVGRFLNSPAISSIGVLSYSLYLWQQPFLNRNSPEAFCSFPLNLILTFVAGLASFLLIETPFLRLRARLEQPVSRRSCDVATA